MATGETILQHWLFTRFALPFLLIFFIVFGILEKTKLFGENKKQLNALISFVIGLIFVGAVYPTLVVSNLILFLTVAIVVMFIALLLWGFVSGEEPKLGTNKTIKWVVGIVIIVAVLIALLWAMGVEQGFFGTISNALFKQSWSSDLWINIAFVVVVIAAIVLAIGKKQKK